MHQLFRQLLEKESPKMNSVMVRGLAVNRVAKIEEYIENVFKSAAKSFPPGLEYIGYRRCSPIEEYTESTRSRNNKRTADIARSDIYMCKYQLRWQGKDLPVKYIYLPFLREGGLMWLGGSPYHISPVLTDKVISVGFDSIFVRLLRDKLTFKRCYHGYVIDGRRETIQVVWSQIYRNSSAKRKVPPTTKANSTVIHYLLAKMGFYATMRKLLGFDPIVSEVPFDRNEYPNKDWVVCSSSQLKPTTYIGEFYKGTSIQIAVPRSRWNNTTKSIIGSVFYLLDHFPTRLTLNSLDNKELWMILLGHIIFSGNYTEGKLYKSIYEHFVSLEEYIDDVIAMKLSESGYPVSDLYDLLGLMIQHFNEWLAGIKGSINSVYGKDLEIDYYVGFETTSGIFRFVFNLNKQAARKELTEKDVIDILNRNIKPRGVYKLRSGNLAVSGMNYSGDNIYPKVTAIMAEQESLPGPKRGKHKRKVPDVTKRLHMSMLEVGSLLYLPKNNPTPTARMNPYTSFDHTLGTIVPRMHTELLERTQSMLDGQMPDELPR